MSKDDVQVFPDRQGKPEHHFYVLVADLKTLRCFLMTRNYSLIGDGNHYDIEYAQKYAVQIWKGWKPIEMNQLPDWAVDLPKSRFTAFWMWNK